MLIQWVHHQLRYQYPNTFFLFCCCWIVEITEKYCCLLFFCFPFYIFQFLLRGKIQEKLFFYEKKDNKYRWCRFRFTMFPFPLSNKKKKNWMNIWDTSLNRNVQNISRRSLKFVKNSLTLVFCLVRVFSQIFTKNFFLEFFFLLLLISTNLKLCLTPTYVHSNLIILHKTLRFFLMFIKLCNCQSRIKKILKVKMCNFFFFFC